MQWGGGIQKPTIPRMPVLCMVSNCKRRKGEGAHFNHKVIGHRGTGRNGRTIEGGWGPGWPGWPPREASQPWTVA